MRAKPDWGVGPPVAFIEERRFLRYRRIVVPVGRVQWYKALFEADGLFRPRRACKDADLLSSKGRRTVLRFTPPPGLLAASLVARNGTRPHLEEPSVAPRPPLPLTPPTAPERVPEGAPTAAATLTAAAPRPAAPEASLVLKEEAYPFPTLLHGIFTVPRAEREFHNLHILRTLHFPAVEPLACGHSGLGILYHRSFLITEEFRGAVNLRQWAKGKVQGIFKPQLKEALAEFLREVARLHLARCYVRTLYGKNILARRKADGAVELALCDVPRLWWFQQRGLSFALASTDLATLDKWARLVLTPRERLRLLKTYLERLGEGPPLRAWIRRILKRRRRLQHATFWGRTSRRLKIFFRKVGLGNYWPF